MNRLDSLHTGKAIVNILTSKKEIADTIGKKIYPLVVSENTTFPLIVYRRNGLSTEKNKDVRLYGQSVLMEFAIAGDSYTQSLELADKVADTLIGIRGKFSNINITDITLDNATEDYLEDAYIQTLIFNIKIE